MQFTVQKLANAFQVRSIDPSSPHSLAQLIGAVLLGIAIMISVYWTVNRFTLEPKQLRQHPFIPETSDVLEIDIIVVFGEPIQQAPKKGPHPRHDATLVRLIQQERLPTVTRRGLDAMSMNQAINNTLLASEAPISGTSIVQSEER